MMLRGFHAFSLVVLGIAAACATLPPEKRGGDPAVNVPARAETVPVGTSNEDAADDPAIWRNAADPAQSLIVGTDKKGGLYVYDLAGREKSFMPGAGLNNVDLVELPDGLILALASDRSDLESAHILVARLDPATATLTRLARIAIGPGEGYGICRGEVREDGSFTVFSAPKNGIVYRTHLQFDGETLIDRTETLTTVPSQPEGCVADPRTNTLYIGEEAAGIWAIDMTSGDKRLVARTGTGMLVADVEGLALVSEGSDGGYLVASSQGDNAFGVYRLPEMASVGRFRIAGGALGSVEETDGIEIDSRSFGPAFPGGIFIAQDGVNPPRAQNFKLVRWDDVMKKLTATDQ